MNTSSKNFVFESAQAQISFGQKISSASSLSWKARGFFCDCGRKSWCSKILREARRLKDRAENRGEICDQSKPPLALSSKRFLISGVKFGKLISSLKRPPLTNGNFLSVSSRYGARWSPPECAGKKLLLPENFFEKRKTAETNIFISRPIIAGMKRINDI